MQLIYNERGCGTVRLLCERTSVLLLLAIVLTCAAPLLVSALARVRPQTDPACAEPLHLPGYAYAVLAGLAAIGIVPAAFSALGWHAVLAVGFGLLAPWGVRLVFERAAAPRRGAVPAASEGIRFRSPAPQAPQTGLALLALGLGGIALHSFLDGAVLFSFGAPSASPVLAPLVLLDRVTLGFVAWALLLPLGGRLMGAVALAVISGMTALGYVAVGFIAARLVGDPVVAWINAALSGVVLYLMISHAFAHGRKHRHTAGVGSPAMRLSRRV